MAVPPLPPGDRPPAAQVLIFDGWFQGGPSLNAAGDLESTAHFYAPLAITSAGGVTCEGPSQTLSATGYLYGQGRFNIAV